MRKKASVIAERAVKEAEYIARTKCTVRECAKHFGISKSTCYKDMTVILPEESISLTKEIRDVFKDHIEVRAMRGGFATQEKFRQAKRGE